MPKELYLVHRPKLFKHIVGQDAAVMKMKGFFDTNEFPHCTMFTGPSGCGKTTAARICAKKLGCDPYDFKEINAADTRGIDDIRKILRQMGLAPAVGKVRVWLIDEAQMLVSQAQNAFLKALEDTPDHVYFMLATTDPQKLLKTIHTRSTKFAFKLCSDKALLSLLDEVAAREKKKVPKSVCKKIVEVSGGSARQALVCLHAVINLKTEKQMLDGVENTDLENQAFELCKKIIFNPRVTWEDVAPMIQEIADEPESIRRMMINFASTVCLGCGKFTERAYLILDAFSDPWYDTGKAGLTRACYEAVHAGK